MNELFIVKSVILDAIYFTLLIVRSEIWEDFFILRISRKIKVLIRRVKVIKIWELK